MRCPVMPAVLAALSACGAAAPPASASTSAASDCDVLLARYRAVLASAARTCTTADDCGVYGGLDPDAVCGGATDRTTADALEALEVESAAARCPVPGYSCPPIAPACVDGVCH